MVWFLAGRRPGVSWRDETISPPPLPLVVFCVLVITLLYLESSGELEERVESKKTGFKIGLILLPMVVILLSNAVALARSYVQNNAGVPPEQQETPAENWSTAVPPFLVLLLLLIMVHYQPSFQSGFRFF